MTSTRLDPPTETTADVYSRDHHPVLSIGSGDSVVVRFPDADVKCRLSSAAWSLVRQLWTRNGAPGARSDPRLPALDGERVLPGG